MLAIITPIYLYCVSRYTKFGLMNPGQRTARTDAELVALFVAFVDCVLSIGGVRTGCVSMLTCKKCQNSWHEDYAGAESCPYCGAKLEPPKKPFPVRMLFAFVPAVCLVVVPVIVANNRHGDGLHGLEVGAKAGMIVAALTPVYLAIWATREDAAREENESDKFGVRVWRVFAKTIGLSLVNFLIVFGGCVLLAGGGFH